MARLDPEVPDPLPRGGINRTLRLVIILVVVLLLLGWLFRGGVLGPMP